MYLINASHSFTKLSTDFFYNFSYLFQLVLRNYENFIFRLEMLDGKRVSDVTRSFLKRFATERKLKGTRPNIDISDAIEGKFPIQYFMLLWYS